MDQLRKLFEPITVGRLQLKNRLVMLAMDLCLSEGGEIPNRLADFLERRAAGGAGLIISPFAPVLTEVMKLPGLYGDSSLPAARELTRRVHSHGTPITAQLIIMDECVTEKGGKPGHVSPSGIAKSPAATPRALSVAEIRYLVSAFGEAAARARRAGFDAVEVHAGIGFLVNQFLSPATNKRTDDYGGSLENRLRFLLEILDSVHSMAGRDYTCLCRISAEEFMPGGHTLDDTARVVAILNGAGVDAYDVQVGWHESKVPLVQASVKRGAYAYAAEAVKKHTSLPVVAAYRINDPVTAERIVAEGKADMVGMARPFMADPDFARKAAEGRIDEIRPCIACCRCLDRIFTNQVAGCSVNPSACNEAASQVTPAARSKKVLVVGGGPAGIEAAITAAQRGHRVTLWDDRDAPGGQLATASAPPLKEEIANFRSYLQGQLKKNGVTVLHGRKASAADVLKFKPDAVIVAAGADPIVPDIPGATGANVATAVEVLDGSRDTGNEVVIVGGGMVGCETAEFLAAKGKKVTLVEMLPRPAGDVGPVTRWTLLARLRTAGIVTETRARVVEINRSGVVFEQDGKTRSLNADTIVLAVGMRPNRELVEALRGEVAEIYEAGDCVRPRRIGEAIESGLRAGCQV